MTAASDIVAQPLLAIELIIALALLAAAVIGFSLWRRLKGAWYRAGAALALILWLLDPAAREEQREPLTDIAVMVVDESQSQTIGDRSEIASAAAAAIAARIDALSPADGPLELRTVRVRGDGADGTELLSALAEAVADIPEDRLAGAVLITDGAVVDGDRPLQAFSDRAGAAPPAHLLLTGRENEFDRRIVLENAPAFGLVGDPVLIRFRVEETGAAPAGLSAPGVSLHIDGVEIARATARIGEVVEARVQVEHAGANVVELRAEAAPGELTTRNNAVAFSINGVRDRLRVLLVSGEPYAGERTWRNLLKSDPSVDLVHFTILRPPGKQSYAATNELALIPFPTRELFEVKLDEFELIVFDRYRRWGILEGRYIQNIANYVEKGGAVLVATGPAFAGLESIYRSALADVLPAEPTSDVFETAFRPDVTALGDRHPVTRGLPGGAVGDAAPSWGRWFRQVEVAALSGDVLMQGPSERPLLILDRVGEGRVALLASDQAWLWARGYEGGGPQAELLRRLAHWMMKEPELEENALTAAPSPGGFVIERRSLEPGDKRITVTDPSGAETVVDLAPAGPGLWRAEVETETLGLHRLTDAADSALGAAEDGRRAEPLEAVAVVGPPSPQEFADPISTDRHLKTLVRDTGGGVIRLAADGPPEIRRVREGRGADGDGWIGFPRREAYRVAGATLTPLFPSWALFGLAALFAIAAWRAEGRLGSSVKAGG